MTEREMLLRAVCENPDDDTPRLVFADWLDENGEPELAEFIRLQVGAEGIPLSSPTGQEMFVRERELLCAHEPCWRASLPDPFHPHPFVRGFVEAATIEDQQSPQVADLEALFVAAPLVDLTIHSLHDPGILAAVPATSRLRTLTIGLSDPSEESLELFMTKSDLGGLKSLTVVPVGIDWRRLSVMPPLWTRLRERFKELLVVALPD